MRPSAPETKSPGQSFLALPLAGDAPDLEISQGWIYAEDERVIHPDIPLHHAVDFKAPWGTPVYAPADGWALASYSTYDRKDSQGRTIGYGFGLFVQLWHESVQTYTLYAHLSSINEALVPYVEPSLGGGGWTPNQAMQGGEKFRQEAQWVKKGDLLGAIGYTGLLIGGSETPSHPSAVDPERQPTWDPHGAHLHWEVFERSAAGEKQFIDPFGIYGERGAYASAFTRAQGLMQAHPDGSPQFAR